MILPIELVKNKPHRLPYPLAGAPRAHRRLSRGVLLRPLGDVIYFMPPYVITEDAIRLMAEVALAASGLLGLVSGAHRFHELLKAVPASHPDDPRVRR